MPKCPNCGKEVNSPNRSIEN